MDATLAQLLTHIFNLELESQRLKITLEELEATVAQLKGEKSPTQLHPKQEGE